MRLKPNTGNKANKATSFDSWEQELDKADMAEADWRATVMASKEWPPGNELETAERISKYHEHLRWQSRKRLAPFLLSPVPLILT
jgi:hypothetical protein